MSRDTHLPQRHDVAFDGVVQTIPSSTMLFTADQMDDLHWFFHGFHAKKNGGDQILCQPKQKVTF
jgi:hypothetical protein